MKVRNPRRYLVDDVRTDRRGPSARLRLKASPNVPLDVNAATASSSRAVTMRALPGSTSTARCTHPTGPVILKGLDDLRSGAA